MKKYRHAAQLERNVASPAPAAPMPKPHGRMNSGSRIIFKRHPLIVPTLACKDAPSALTRYAMTTFRIAGVAPKVTVHFKYPAVDAAVCASAPKRPSSGVFPIVQIAENKTLQMIQQ